MAPVTTIGTDPARIDIDVDAGEPVDFTIPVTDGTGAAQDVTGWTVVAQIRRDRGSPVLHTLTTTAGSGGVRVTATGAQTALWPDWRLAVARWDLWLTPPASEPDVLAAGWVRVRSTH